MPFHDRGHINVMLVLQSCTDPLHILPGLSSETFPTSSDGIYDVNNIEVEKDVVVIDEGFIAIYEEANFPGMKPKPDEVSYVYVCLIRHISTVARNVSCFCDASIFGHLKQLHCSE